MSALFESLGHAMTSGGMLRLWRRHDLALGLDVYEVKLDDEYLMTSLLPDSEIALSRLGLGAVTTPPPWDVVVGGLGLGHTAVAALEEDRVGSLIVVEVVGELIAWHRERLVPCADTILSDPRARLIEGDFFALSRGGGYDHQQPGRQFDAILVDIDHTPEHHLDPDHGDFYSVPGLTALSGHLRPGGAFSLWSDGLPLAEVTALLCEVFSQVDATVVTFDNIVTGGQSSATIYVALNPVQGR